MTVLTVANDSTDPTGGTTWVVAAAVLAIGIIIVVFRAWRQGKRIRATREQNTAASARELAEHHRPRWSPDAASFGSRPVDWGIAVGAPFALCRGADQDRLRFRDAQEEREILAEAWGVTDRSSMLQTLYDVLLAGHRDRFSREIAVWSEMPDEEARAVEARLRAGAKHSDDTVEMLWRFRRVRANDRDIRSVDFLAWDFVRLAMLARAGATAGYLSEAEASDVLLMTAGDLRERYGSWEELGESFRIGRWYWNSQGGQNEAIMDEHDLSRQEALLSAESPWARVPWDAELPAPRMLLVDALRDHGMRSLDPDEYSDPGEPVWSRRINEALRQRELADREG